MSGWVYVGLFLVGDALDSALSGKSGPTSCLGWCRIGAMSLVRRTRWWRRRDALVRLGGEPNVFPAWRRLCYAVSQVLRPPRLK